MGICSCVPPDAASEPGSAEATATGAPSVKAPSRLPDLGAEDHSRAPKQATRAPDPPIPAVSASGTNSASPPDRPLSEVFRDFFARSTLGPDYNATGSAWRIQDGRVCAARARNHPLWLRRRIPINARIEFDATSLSPDGDLKVEAWGDGISAATGASYDNATSYVFIYGGWKNRLHVLARLDEHGSDRKARTVDPSDQLLQARPVRAHHAYHFKIERDDGRSVRWFVDDIEIHTFTDPRPLTGAGHDHFAFNDWDSPVCFDNLVIAPL